MTPDHPPCPPLSHRLDVRLMSKGQQCAPWFVPVNALDARGGDPTAGWADMQHLLLVRCQIGDGDLYGRASPKNQARDYITPHWEQMRSFLASVTRYGPKLRGAGAGVALPASPPWKDPSTDETSNLQLLRWTTLAAWLDRASPELQIGPHGSEERFPEHHVLERLERDQFAQGHWIWSHPAARRLWVRGTLEHLLELQWGNPTPTLPHGWEMTRHAAPGQRSLQSLAIELNAALLGSSGDGYLALRAGGLLGAAGLQEVLSGALHETTHFTWSAPWAMGVINRFLQEKRIVAQSIPTQWSPALRRSALLSPVRELRITAAASVTTAAIPSTKTSDGSNPVVTEADVSALDTIALPSSPSPLPVIPGTDAAPQSPSSSPPFQRRKAPR